jgi:transposase InsO family protein
MVKRLLNDHIKPTQAALEAGVSVPTAKKWLARYLAEGAVGLQDRRSRPRVSPRAISAAKALAIVELRRCKLVQGRIAHMVAVSKTTVGRVLKRAGLSRLKDLEPVEPVVRYEHARPGELIHIDIKKLARIQRPGHRIHGDRSTRVRGASWEYLFVAVDDHARIGFTDLYGSENGTSAAQFLHNTVAYFGSLGVHVRRILTDNGGAFHSKAVAHACECLCIRHSFTRAYRPQTNGKAERFIQSALREWAYGIPYNHSSERADMLERWIHHYNWHRPHQGIKGLAPISRLAQSRNNLLTLHN